MNVFVPVIPASGNKNGTIIVQAPKAGDWHGPNYRIDTYAQVAPTGEYNSIVSGRFDDPRYYTGDAAS